VCFWGLVILGTELTNLIIVLNLLSSAIQAEADSDEVYAQIMLQPEAVVSSFHFCFWFGTTSLPFYIKLHVHTFIYFS
jgi:hypothetical protein